MGLAILLQEPKQAGLSGAFGLGGDSQMLGTSPTSGIAKLTRFLAVVFFALCLSVGIIAKEEGSTSILQDDDPVNASVTTSSEEEGVVGIGDALGDDASIESTSTDAAGTDTTGATDGADSTGGAADTGATESDAGESTGEADATSEGGAATEDPAPGTESPSSGEAGQR